MVPMAPTSGSALPVLARVFSYSFPAAKTYLFLFVPSSFFFRMDVVAANIVKLCPVARSLSRTPRALLDWGYKAIWDRHLYVT